MITKLSDELYNGMYYYFLVTSDTHIVEQRDIYVKEFVEAFCDKIYEIDGIESTQVIALCGDKSQLTSNFIDLIKTYVDLYH